MVPGGSQSLGSRFNDSLGDAVEALRGKDHYFKLQAGLVLAWIVVSLATVGAVAWTGGPADKLGADVRAEMAVGGPVLLVTNNSSSRWTDITYTLNESYVYRQAVLEPGDHKAIPVGRAARAARHGAEGPGHLMRAGANASVACEGQAVSVGGGSLRVLVVDDDAEVLDFLEVLLSLESISTVRADDAESALRILADGPVGLVLVDIAMPGLDGLELCRRIRAAPATQKLPVVVLSARPGQVAESEAMAAGANHFLHKPFDNDVLVKLVREKLRT
jgi:CheY-like chemotaxis protein